MHFKILMKEWNTLHVGKDGVLRHQSGPYTQLVLPQRYQHLVYKELHREIGHLGCDRVIQPARERFYWPRMQNDITHYYITQVCSCIKQKRPHVKTKTPMKHLNNKKRSHTQLDSRKQVIAFQDRVMTINIKEAQHPLKREKQVIDKSSIMLKISTKSMHRVLV